MPVRAYYIARVTQFLNDHPNYVLGVLASHHHHDLEQPQRSAWLDQISILKAALLDQPLGLLFLELSIPRMGKRADAVLVTSNRVFVLEFKVGADIHTSAALEQVEDYALDLKNFHEGSHQAPIIPVLVSTDAPETKEFTLQFAADLVARPLATNANTLRSLIEKVCSVEDFEPLDATDWMSKGYRPTPTIVEAA